MLSEDLLRNFLRRSVSDFASGLCEGAAWDRSPLILASPAFDPAALSTPENRLTSIHASHPIEIGSVWSEREVWCSSEWLKKKGISSFVNFGPLRLFPFRLEQGECQANDGTGWDKFFFYRIDFEG